MRAGAQHDADGVTPVFSENDKKRLHEASITILPLYDASWHVVHRGLNFYLGGPEYTCGIMVYIYPNAPPPHEVYVDSWGNGMWWYQHWPSWVP